eukprot:CAMPEP_0172618220 /NCGR_PEP_ID=MMETSP1068-20121228/77834_1 /TAXON_ID=35684 /ORGANISM="Pseudopedinella elastica, Strain CCMP716" /LENGTH=165 /DNA_ID=CAMNT_0013424307 /DNA_START=513 /DNA_END=1010 /DNA_ORIENTATION=+
MLPSPSPSTAIVAKDKQSAATARVACSDADWHTGRKLHGPSFSTLKSLLLRAKRPGRNAFPAAIGGGFSPVQKSARLLRISSGSSDFLSAFMKGTSIGSLKRAESRAVQSNRISPAMAPGADADAVDPALTASSSIKDEKGVMPPPPATRSKLEAASTSGRMLWP